MRMKEEDRKMIRGILFQVSKFISSVSVFFMTLYVFDRIKWHGGLSLFVAFGTAVTMSSFVWTFLGEHPCDDTPRE